uniref:Aromatic-L-amino-acid decarboxylase n=1 Tax=Ciona savignyi TaxID=51511 RepID=H2Y9D7_CIOSA
IEPDTFRIAATAMIDYIINYNKEIGNRQTFPDVQPGFMRNLLRAEAPKVGESWEDVYSDIERVVMQGMTHWVAPGFFAYFPAALSFPALLADLLCGGAPCIGFSWAASPSCTEMETVMMDWLAKALDLPPCFIHGRHGPGGGVIQGTATESMLVTMIAARNKVISRELSRDPKLSKYDILPRMVVYTSDCSHSSVEKVGLLSMIEVRKLSAGRKGVLRRKTLQDAIDKDKKNNKIPTFVCATLGTTPCCTYDNVDEIGRICKFIEDIWLHIDAAYAGAALICPEFRHIADGIKRATSFNLNLHKWLMVNFDCSGLWVRDSSYLTDSANVNALFLEHQTQQTTIDYRHWQIPLGRRYGSLKIWFVLCMVGIDGLQTHVRRFYHVRRGVAEAKYFENLVRKDERFEIVFPVTLGLVCLKLKRPGLNIEENAINEELNRKIQADRRIHLVPSIVHGIYFLRVATGSVNCSRQALDNCWDVIREMSQLV